MRVCVRACVHVSVCVCVCVDKPVAVELRCHATALIEYAKTKAQISCAICESAPLFSLHR